MSDDLSNLDPFALGGYVDRPIGDGIAPKLTPTRRERIDAIADAVVAALKVDGGLGAPSGGPASVAATRTIAEGVRGLTR
jgi:hypothetical protein